jgi:hypothetical protein
LEHGFLRAIVANAAPDWRLADKAQEFLHETAADMHLSTDKAMAIYAFGTRTALAGDARPTRFSAFFLPGEPMSFKLIDTPLRHLALAAGRWKNFDSDHELLAGMHLPFPGLGLGHVRKEPKGYAWVPAEFSPIPAATVGK